jgi:hypothetical protein
MLDDKLTDLVILSKDNNGVYVSWGVALYQNEVPSITSKVMIDEPSLNCFDAVWIQD